MRPKKANTNGRELIVFPHPVRGLLTDAELIPGANPGVSRPVGLPGTSGHAGMIGASDREAGLNHAAQSSDRCGPRSRGSVMGWDQWHFAAVPRRRNVRDERGWRR